MVRGKAPSAAARGGAPQAPPTSDRGLMSLGVGARSEAKPSEVDKN
jgi:hypothetical protein